MKVVRVVGYCASCRYFRRWEEERPVRGLARFGRCEKGVHPVGEGNGACDRYKPARRGQV